MSVCQALSNSNECTTSGIKNTLKSHSNYQIVTVQSVEEMVEDEDVQSDEEREGDDDEGEEPEPSEEELVVQHELLVNYISYCESMINP